MRHRWAQQLTTYSVLSALALAAWAPRSRAPPAEYVRSLVLLVACATPALWLLYGSRVARDACARALPGPAHAARTCPAPLAVAADVLLHLAPLWLVGGPPASLGALAAAYATVCAWYAAIRARLRDLYSPALDPRTTDALLLLWLPACALAVWGSRSALRGIFQP